MGVIQRDARSLDCSSYASSTAGFGLNLYSVRASHFTRAGWWKEARQTCSRVIAEVLVGITCKEGGCATSCQIAK